MNAIVNLKTVHSQSPEGPVSIVVMGLNIPDPDSADSFIQHAAEKFTLQRTCSPPTTDRMLITVVTSMPLQQIVNRWHQIAANDPILNFYMSQMKAADVIRGTTVGVTLETASLVRP